MPAKRSGDLLSTVSHTGLSFSVLSAWAILMAANPALADQVVISADGNTVITATPITIAAAGTINSGLVTSSFPGWSITTGGAGPGSVSVPASTYTAADFGSRGGDKIVATYSSQDANSGWIQIVTTNYPLPGDPRSPRVDVLPLGETTTPLVPPSFTTPFHDAPSRDYASLASHGNSVTWSASLYPVEKTGAQAATVYNGINWGWTMKPALQGSSTGIFSNATPSGCACSGLGTSSFSEGAGDPSTFSFSGASFVPTVGQEFDLGSLTFHNGSNTNNASGVGLDLSINFDNLTGHDTTLHSSLNIVNTPNTNDPVASADYLNFSSGGFSNSFNVLEGSTATANLLAKIVGVTNSGVTLTGDLTDDMPAVTSNDVSYMLQLIGWSDITAGGFQETTPGDTNTVVSQVAEPSSIFLMLAGLIGLLLFSKFKKPDVAC